MAHHLILLIKKNIGIKNAEQINENLEQMDSN